MAQTRVVTISHTTGAGGDNIGRRVATGIGFRYVDEEIIQLAAERHGIDAEIVADAERRKGLLDRILGDMAAPPMMLEPTGGMTMLPREAFVTREDVRTLIVDAIKETADRGNVVIVSHAAGIPLTGRRDVLRSATFDNGGRTVETAKPIGYGWRTGPFEHAGIGGFYDLLGPNNYSVEDGSYAKVREATLTYHVGSVRGFGDCTLGLVGRNLFTFTNYSGYDPETGVAGGQTGSGLINQVDAFDFPTLRSYTFSLSTRF